MSKSPKKVENKEEKQAIDSILEDLQKQFPDCEVSRRPSYITKETKLEEEMQVKAHQEVKDKNLKEAKVIQAMMDVYNEKYAPWSFKSLTDRYKGDPVGKNFGSLTVIGRDTQGKADEIMRSPLYLCECKCGRTVKVHYKDLLHKKSCGKCLNPRILFSPKVFVEKLGKSLWKVCVRNYTSSPGSGVVLAAAFDTRKEARIYKKVLQDVLKVKV